MTQIRSNRIRPEKPLHGLLLPSNAIRNEGIVQVATAYLEHLSKEGRFEEAANLCPRLLKVTPPQFWLSLHHSMGGFQGNSGSPMPSHCCPAAGGPLEVPADWSGNAHHMC